MKSFNYLSLLLLIVLLVFASCRKDHFNEGFDLPQFPNPEITFDGSVSGVVVDESGAPLSDVSLYLSNEQTFSDVNGHFTFRNVVLKRKGSLIRASKNGYFYNSKFVGSSLNSMDFTRIQMMSKTLIGTFQTTDGGTFMTADGASVTFPPNAIKRQTGNSYEGTVNVFAKFIDPSAMDAGMVAPGDLRAYNTEDELVQLASFGMLAVELETNLGAKLNLIESEEAIIEIPVPDELLISAPSSIPLWHFNENSGYWMEEGNATIQGDKYVGSVNHFSFWNCDDPFEIVYVQGYVKNRGIGLGRMFVTVKILSSGLVGYNYTDEDGFFSGLMPKDELLEISIFNACRQEVYHEEIGPFSDDISLPDISINNDSKTIQIKAKLTCDTDILTRAYLIVNHNDGQSLLEADENGKIDATVNICINTMVEIFAYDLETNAISEKIFINTEGVDLIDLDNFEVCNGNDEYIYYKIYDDELIIYNDVYALYDSGSSTTLIRGESVIDSSSSLSLRFEGASPNSYTPSEMTVSGMGAATTYALICYSPGGNSCNDIELEITSFGGVGDFVIGSFSGSFKSNQGSDIPIEGDFKVLREN